MIKFDYLFDYTPYFSGGANDGMSRTLLSFKRNHASAFEFMKQVLGNYFDLSNFDKSKTVICCVPSHDVTLFSPIQRLCSYVAENCGFLDGTHLIRKLFATTSFCRSGFRDAVTLRDSLEIDGIIKGLDVILLDDVATTGTSFKVVATLLMQAGANSVQCFALGKTVKLSERRLQNA